jgi:hypothetical protein
MRNTLFAALAALLITTTATQVAAAAEPHHHAHKAQQSQQFRNANNAVAPATSSELGVYSGGWSAPAGH